MHAWSAKTYKPWFELPQLTMVLHRAIYTRFGISLWSKLLEKLFRVNQGFMHLAKLQNNLKWSFDAKLTIKNSAIWIHLVWAAKSHGSMPYISMQQVLCAFSFPVPCYLLFRFWVYPILVVFHTMISLTHTDLTAFIT